MTWILTRSGRQFDYADPQPDQIDIVDIAHGLAAENRFSGQTREPYSVAQHSVLVSYDVPFELRLEGLLHDASEAYMKDIPRPLKGLLPDYKALEKRVEAVIREKYGLPAEGSPEIKESDMRLLATERRDLLPESPIPWVSTAGIRPLRYTICPLSYQDALLFFFAAMARDHGGAPMKIPLHIRITYQPSNPLDNFIASGTKVMTPDGRRAIVTRCIDTPEGTRVICRYEGSSLEPSVNLPVWQLKRVQED